MKSPVIKFFLIYPGVDLDDRWRFGYSAFDNGHIIIWKNGIKRKARVVDVGKKDGVISFDTTKDPIEATGGAKGLYDMWYKSIVVDDYPSSVIDKTAIVQIYDRLNGDEDDGDIDEEEDGYSGGLQKRTKAELIAM